MLVYMMTEQNPLTSHEYHADIKLQLRLELILTCMSKEN